MRNFNIKRQINKLYTLTTVSYFRIAGASWVALLALRGFSLLQIGILESIFHIASSCFEIPSGVVADVVVGDVADEIIDKCNEILAE